ncbi:MAG: type II toxin-antitoxin system RelE/ParE family toxin [Gemmatimonadetes bacterium]|nr:type II toxin-antitoxin system RelE/ParE family toxin [Gemmatimonadota bacterium]
MRFVETPVFTASLRRLMSDTEYRELQLALVLRPEQGRLIPGTGGLRKLRWRTAGRGKRGGLRTIYFWAVNEDTCYMLYVYSKAERVNLSVAQLRALARAVREEFE